MKSMHWCKLSAKCAGRVGARGTAVVLAGTYGHWFLLVGERVIRGASVRLSQYPCTCSCEDTVEGSHGVKATVCTHAPECARSLAVLMPAVCALCPSKQHVRDTARCGAQL